jgi:hypothetical protein
MPTARELLAQVDVLMRRNRPEGELDIPELTDAVTEPVLRQPMRPTALDDIPELTDTVEEIEIASSAELPDDDSDVSTWLGTNGKSSVSASPNSVAVTRFARRGRSVTGDVAAPAEAAEASPPAPSLPAVPPTSPEAPPLHAVLALERQSEAGVAAPIEVPGATSIEADREPEAASDEPPPPPTDVSVDTGRLAVFSPEPSAELASTATPLPSSPVAPELPTSTAASTPARDDWARWEALAEEIRMQVLQRLDIFTESRLREQLSVHLKPIVDRAGEELVATINAQIGELLRAHVAETIEREIEKWRKQED